MRRDGEQRPSWRGRALVLALFGGLVGWIVAYAGMLVLLQLAFGVHGPVSFDQVVAWAGGDAGRGGDLILGALVVGGPCGAALGLIFGVVWFLVSRWAGIPDPGPAPDR